MIVVSIDPSINFCGIAVHYNRSLLFYGLINPDKSCEEFISKSRSVFSKIYNIYSAYKEEFKEIDSDIRLITELPQYWGTSGYAARESGSIFKLTFLIGMICSITTAETITPNGWKGQMPKIVIANRLVQDYPQLNVKINDNIMDAIGIGKWYIDKYYTEIK